MSQSERISVSRRRGDSIPRELEAGSRPYLEVDRRRSLGQIASVVLPYLAVWVLAALIRAERPGRDRARPGRDRLPHPHVLALPRPHAQLDVLLAADANSRWGHLLGYLLFTPYRWWQRQHRIHHAHTGDLDHRGVGEINTMTLAEYESASRLRRLGYRLYRNPLLMLLVGPSLVFLFERRFPQRGMTPRDPGERRGDEPRTRGLGAGLERDRRLADLPADPGHDPDRRRRHRRLDALHPAPVRGHLLPGARTSWQFELAALQGSSYLQLPRPLAWAVGNANFHHVHHLSAKIPNYRLRAAHESHPMFRRTPVVTLRSSIETFRLKLWDTESESLVPFPGRRRDGQAGVTGLRRSAKRRSLLSASA